MKNKKWFHIAVGFIAGFSYVACGSSGGESINSNKISSALADTETTLVQNSFVGTWKGNVYTSSTTQHPDFTLTLNADGSYTCSGFTQTADQDGATKSDTTYWTRLCQTPVKWETTKTALRLSFNYMNNVTQVHNFVVLIQDSTTLAISDSGSDSYSDTITELTKVE